MREIEKAPDWTGSKAFDKVIEILGEESYKPIIDKVNNQYLYWDKVKYIKNPKNYDPEALWASVKFSRSINARNVAFGKYKFSFNLTDFIQKELHNFDLNIGGQLGAKSIIPEDDKKRYLVSSIMEEAIASSQIEGAVTTRKKAKEMLRKSKKPRNRSEQMIVNNYITIKRIVEIKDKELNQERLLEIHKLVTNLTLDDPADEGRYRDNNEVDVIDVTDGEIIHTPPDFKELGHLMESLFMFFNDENESQFIHPIIKGCIIHFLVGFFHPFVDGNGRTARALFYWYLLKKGYWLTEYLSISRLIVKSKTQYAMAFIYSEVDDNDLSYFITYKLKTMRLAFESLSEYIQRKISEKKQFVQFQRIRGINERQALVLNWFYEEPDMLLTVKELENRLSIANQTGRSDLFDLVKKKYLDIVDLNRKTKAFCKSDSFDELLRNELPHNKHNK